MDLSKQEREAGGVLDMDTKIVSTITSHGPGYLDKDLEQIVGFQTDKPFKRSLQPFGGIRMAQNACHENGYEVDPEVVKIFTEYRKTHNQGVFDAYTPEMRLARKSAIITGLPDAYGRGRIIGDYRRVALYGTDWLIEDKKPVSYTHLLRICKLAETAGRAKSYGRHDTVDELADCLDSYFEQLAPLTPLTTEIRRCIIEEDEISDDASSNLKHIRRSIGMINDKVHSTLTSLVNGSLRSYLQDPIITMRGDRYCLPVKAEYRSQVSGMIHDQSSTGSTLFIEPMAVVKLNNDLKELYGKEQEEIQIILALSLIHI